MSDAVLEWLLGGWSLGRRESDETSVGRSRRDSGSDATRRDVAQDHVPPEDAPEFIARLRAGDEQAFQTIFDTYWAPLCRFASRYVQADDVVEDVVQRVFIQLAAARTSWVATGSVRAYLYAATRRSALQVRRNAGVRARLTSAVSEFSPAVPKASHGPDIPLDRAELGAAVQAALDTLSPRVRLVAMHRLYDGMSHAEIAAVLGVSEGTVNKQLTLAMRALRERLREVR